MRNQPPCTQWSDKLGLRYEDLSSAERIALDTHLQTCDGCRNALTDYNFLTSRIRTLPPPTVQPFPRLSPQTGQSYEEETKERIRPMGSSPEGRKQRRRNAITKSLAACAFIACAFLVSFALFSFKHNENSGGGPASGITKTVYSEHFNTVRTILWSPDGKDIASIGDDHKVRVWDTRTGSTLFVTSTSSSSVLAWSPNGNYIAFAKGDSPNAIEVENIKTRDIAFTCSYGDRNVYGNSNSLSVIAWSPDGNSIASAYNNNVVQVWHVSNEPTSFTVSSISTATSSISALAWSPDGSRIAVASYLSRIQIWDANTGTHIANYIGHSGGVSAVAWSPDGTRLASASYDNTVRVWDVRNGSTLYVYKEHNGSLSAVAWSPDGKYLVSGGQDTSVRVWNASTGKTIGIYKDYTGPVNAIAWSPTGDYIASASENSIHVWSIR